MARFPKYFVLAILVALSFFSNASSTAIEEAKQAFFERRYDHSLELLVPLWEHTQSGESGYYLGLIYLSPDYKNHNLNKAVEYLKISAGLDSAEAARELSQTYFRFAASLDPSYMLAIYWAKTADRLTFTPSKLIDHQFISTEKGMVAVTQKEMLNLQIRNANDGDVDAQFLLGQRFEYGIGVDVDISESRRWYKKAAESGNSTAALYLGYHFCKGNGVAKDANLANYWFDKVALKATCSIGK